MGDLTAWKVYAPSGLLLVGAGICVITDAAVHRARRGRWVAQGTFGLVTLNAGLSLFGEAVKRRALADVGARG